ncbi:ADP-ribosyltransferase [Nocardiopsis sp. N85]|nr:ADP-ribosyltransferase [Nocardiopsis sp. N85]
MSESSRTAIKVLTGIEVPTADPPAMRAAAEVYEQLGMKLRTDLTEVMNTVRGRVRRNFGGRASDYYDRSVKQFTEGENDYIGAAANTAHTLNVELRKGAANAEYMSAMVFVQFAQLLVEIAWAIATAKFTFGATLKFIPIFKMIRSLAMQRILAWFLITVPGHQIISQIFASMDSVIQRIQIANGTRDTWDHDLTKGAHIGGVVEGLVSAGMSGALGAAFDKQITNIITNRIDLLRDLPDPVPTAGLGKAVPDPLPTPPPLRDIDDLVTPPGAPGRPDPVPTPTPDGPPSPPGVGPTRPDADVPPPPPPSGPRPDPEAPPVPRPDPDTPPGSRPDPAPTPRPDPEGPPLPGGVTPTPVPGAGAGGRGLNRDLADVWARHRDEMVVPFGSNAPPGAVAWNNAANRARFREDMAGVFERNFADRLGVDAARRLGSDYADTMIRSWNKPDLGPQLARTLDDHLPPHVRDHLVRVPEDMLGSVYAHFRSPGTYVTQLGVGAASGAAEGVLGEGLSNAAMGQGFNASVWSATSGASMSTIQQVSTDGALAGIDALSGPPKTPPPEGAPPPSGDEDAVHDPANSDPVPNRTPPVAEPAGDGPGSGRPSGPGSGPGRDTVDVIAHGGRRDDPDSDGGTDTGRRGEDPSTADEDERVLAPHRRDRPIEPPETGGPARLSETGDGPGTERTAPGRSSGGDGDREASSAQDRDARVRPPGQGADAGPDGTRPSPPRDDTPVSPPTGVPDPVAGDARAPSGDENGAPVPEHPGSGGAGRPDPAGDGRTEGPVAVAAPPPGAVPDRGPAQPSTGQGGQGGQGADAARPSRPGSEQGPRNGAGEHGTDPAVPPAPVVGGPEEQGRDGRFEIPTTSTADPVETSLDGGHAPTESTANDGAASDPSGARPRDTDAPAAPPRTEGSDPDARDTDAGHRDDPRDVPGPERTDEAGPERTDEAGPERTDEAARDTPAPDRADAVDGTPDGAPGGDRDPAEAPSSVPHGPPPAYSFDSQLNPDAARADAPTPPEAGTRDTDPADPVSDDTDGVSGEDRESVVTDDESLFDDSEPGEAPPAYEDERSSPPAYPYSDLIDVPGTKDAKPPVPSASVVGDLTWLLDPRSVLPPPLPVTVQVFTAEVPAPRFDKDGRPVPPGADLTTDRSGSTRTGPDDPGQGAPEPRNDPPVTESRTEAPAPHTERTGKTDPPNGTGRDGRTPEAEGRDGTTEEARTPPHDPGEAHTTEDTSTHRESSLPDPKGKGKARDTEESPTPVMEDGRESLGVVPVLDHATGDPAGDGSPVPTPGDRSPERDTAPMNLDYLVSSRFVDLNGVHIDADAVREAIAVAVDAQGVRVPPIVRKEALAHFERRSRRGSEVRAFFGRDGASHTVRYGSDAWRFTVRLSGDRGDGYRRATVTEDGEVRTPTMRTHGSTHEGQVGGSSSQGTKKGLSAKFNVNPLFLNATPDGWAFGPVVSLGGSVGIGLRTMTFGGSDKGSTALEVKGKGAPEVYTAGLRVDVDVAPPPGLGPPPAPPGDGPERGPAVVPRGVALVLPGEVKPRPPAAPEQMRFRPDGTGTAPRGRPRLEHGGLPITVSAIVPKGPGRGRGYHDLGSWLADTLLPPVDGKGGPATGKRAETDRAWREEFRGKLDNESIKQYLPAMDQGPIRITAVLPDGTVRTVHISSPATDYRAKGHSPRVDEFVRRDGAEESRSNQQGRGAKAGFTVGGGFGIDIRLPGGGVRLDAPFVEYGYTRTWSSETRTSSKSGSRETFAMATSDTDDFIAYQAERDLVVELDGEDTRYEFTGDTVEILSLRDALTLDAAARGLPDPHTGRGTDAPAPPYPHLRGDRITRFHGARLDGFSWPNTGNGETAPTPERDTTGPQDATDGTPTPITGDPESRPVTERLIQEVLTGLARELPGIVIPELSRTKDDYAHRPGRKDAPYFDRSPREHRGLRRNRRVAQLNTERIEKALREEFLNNHGEALASRDGLAVHLDEKAVIDIKRTVTLKEAHRPGLVTVRVKADFGALTHQGSKDGRTGIHLGGGAKLESGKGKGATHSGTLTAGPGLARGNPEDARGMAKVMGSGGLAASIARTWNRVRSHGSEHKSDQLLLFPDGSDTWRGSVRFDARLHEYDASDQVKGEDESVPLMSRPIVADYSVVTPKMLSTPTPEAPRASDGEVRALSTDDARALVQGPLAPPPTTPPPTSGEGGGGRTDGRGTEGTGRTDGEGTNDTGHTDGQRTDTTERTDGEGTNTTERTPEQERAERVRREQARRARALIDNGVVERVNTDLGADRGDLGGQARRLLSERVSLAQIAPGRKLLHFLDTRGGRSFFERLFSPTGMAADPATFSPGGQRDVMDMTGGLFSPNDGRADLVTKADPDQVTRMQLTRMQPVLHAETSVSAGTSYSVTHSGSARIGANAGGSTNPVRGDAEGPDALTPADARGPIPLTGLSDTWNFFRSGRTEETRATFTSSLTIVPKAAMGYAFQVGGTVSQAVELMKGWGLAVPGIWSTRHRGWRAVLSDLASGYITARDARQAGIVMDRLREAEDGTLEESAQPDPETIEGVKVREGFEYTGQQVRPADPTAALESLARRLDEQGYELTRSSRKRLLDKLTTQLAKGPGTNAPVAVSVRHKGAPIGHASSPGTVRVNLRTSEPRVEYLASTDEIVESHTWKSEGVQGRSRGGANTVGADHTHLVPAPFEGQHLGPDDQPGHRPLFLTPGGTTGHTASQDTSHTETVERTRTAQLETAGPYAKVVRQSTLELSLEFDRPTTVTRGELNAPLTDRAVITLDADGDGGTIQTLYPYAYLDFTGANDTPRTASAPDGGSDSGSDGGGGGGGRRIDDGSADDHPDLADAMDRHTSGRHTAGEATAFEDGVVIMPTAVGEHGAHVRDTAIVTIARALGWTPGSDDRTEGVYSADDLSSARAHMAERLGLDPRYTPVDSVLDAIALKSLFSQAAGVTEGVPLMKIGSMDWRLGVTPDLRNARVLEVLPDSRLTWSDSEDRSSVDGVDHSGGAVAEGGFRPTGLNTEHRSFDDHAAVMTGVPTVSAASPANAASDEGGTKTDTPPSAEREKRGPVYLIEFDTTWTVGARSEQGLPFLKRSAHQHIGDTRGTMSAWVSQEDAIKLGVVTEEHARGLAAKARETHTAAEAMGRDEQSYDETRGLLSDPVTAYREAHAAHLAERTADGAAHASPETTERLRKAREAYEAQEARTEDARRVHEASTRNWVDSVSSSRDAFHAPRALFESRVAHDTATADTLHERGERVRTRFESASDDIGDAETVLGGHTPDRDRLLDREGLTAHHTRVRRLGTDVQDLLRDLGDPSAPNTRNEAENTALRDRRHALLDEVNRFLTEARDRSTHLADAAARVHAAIDGALDLAESSRGAADGARGDLAGLRTATTNATSDHGRLVEDARHPDVRRTPAPEGSSRDGGDAAPDPRITALDDAGRTLETLGDTTRALGATDDAIRDRIANVLARTDGLTRDELIPSRDQERFHREMERTLTDLGERLFDGAVAEIDRDSAPTGTDLGREAHGTALDEADRLLDDHATADDLSERGEDFTLPGQVTGLDARVADFERDLRAFNDQADRSPAEVADMERRRRELIDETARLTTPVTAQEGGVTSRLDSGRETATAVAERTGPVRAAVDRAERLLTDLRNRVDGIDRRSAALLAGDGAVRDSLTRVRTSLGDMENRRSVLNGRLDGVESRHRFLADTEIPALERRARDLGGLREDLEGLRTRLDDATVAGPTPRGDDGADDGGDPPPGTGGDRGAEGDRDAGGHGRSPRTTGDTASAGGRDGTPPPDTDRGNGGGTSRSPGDGRVPVTDDGGREAVQDTVGTPETPVTASRDGDTGGAPHDRDTDHVRDTVDTRSTTRSDDVSGDRSDPSSRDRRGLFDGVEEVDGVREEAPPAYDAEPSPPHYPYTEPLEALGAKDAKPSVPDPSVTGDLTWLLNPRSMPPPAVPTDLQVFTADIRLDPLGPDGRALPSTTGDTGGEGSGSRRPPGERSTDGGHGPERGDDPGDPDDGGSDSEDSDSEGSDSDAEDGDDPTEPYVSHGSLPVDRDGEAHDLDYLVGSRLVGPGRLRTDGVPDAIERSLRGMRPRMPRALRTQVLAEVERVAGERGMDPFFAGDGHEVTVGADGSRWKVRVKLAADRPDGDEPPAYRHVPIREGEGTDAAVIGGQERTRTVGSGDTLTRGARRGVSVKFTANPLYFGPTFADQPVGPSLTVGASGGTGLRAGGTGGSSKSTAVQAMDNSGPAEVYTADLRMDLGVTRPTGPPTRAPRPSVVRDGMAVILSGKAERRPDDAPAHISLPRRPAGAAAADGASAGADRPAPRRNPRTTHGGLPVKIERIVPQGGEEGTEPTHTDLGSWLADHLVPEGAEGATGKGTKGKAARDLHRTVQALFDNDSLQEYLPHLARGPITLELTLGDGTHRMVRLASSANEYRALGHAPHLGELTHHDGAEHTVSSSGSRSRTIGFSVGGGTNIQLSLPGGGMTRIDVPTLEYVHSRTLDSETHSSSRTGSRRTIARDIADTEDFLAYRVERDLFVHVEGEPTPHAFTGETVEIVSRRDAESLNDAAGGGPRGRDHGEQPRPSMAHLRGDTVTDLSGTTVLGFDRPDQAADADDGAEDGPSATEDRDGGPTVYERLQQEILDSIAREHPGMVIPDMARDRADYARRPGDGEAPPGERTWRERYGLRRNHDIARKNTLRVLDALTPEALHSRDVELTSDQGLMIHLTENAIVDPKLMAEGKEVLRPDNVTVHVHAKFGGLTFDGRTPTETGVRLGGQAMSGDTRGKASSHGLNLTAGAGLLRSRDADARGMGRRMGGASATLGGSRSHTRGTSRGVSHTADDTIFFPGGSDLWRGPVEFTARMSDYEGSDQARGTDQGRDLLGGPIRADYSVITPRVLTESAPPASRRDHDEHRALSEEQARSLIQGPFSTRDTVTDGDGGTRRTGRGDRDGKGREGGDGRRDRRTGGDERREGRGEGGTARHGREDRDGGRREEAGGSERTSGDRGVRDGETPEQARERRRAEDLVRAGGSVERIGIGPPSRTFELFTDFPRGLFQGFERKLRTYLNTTGGRTHFQELLSPDGMADDPSTTAPGGRRSRPEMSGGVLSPGDVRATTATRVEPDRVAEFQQVEMQMISHGETSVEIGTSDTVTKSAGVRVGATGGGTSNRIVDDAAQKDPATAVPPADAVGPTPVGGLNDTWTFFRSGRGTSAKASFTASTTIVPKAALGYAFRLAGRATQAVELLHDRGKARPSSWNPKNLKDLPRTAKTYYRGWTARVHDLMSGYISARDAQEAGIVQDRVAEDEDGTITLSPQDDPADITDVRVRPGFEDSGKRVRPADPTAALASLVEQLRSQRYELTAGSRERLFEALTTRLGNTSGTSEPVSVRVRRVSDSDEPRSGHRAHDAQVHLELLTRERKVEYLASSDAIIESHTWTTGTGSSRSDGTGNAVGGEGVLLQPTPFRGDENPPGQGPDSRPLFAAPAASGGVSSSDTRSRGESGEHTHTVQLEMSGPYAKVEQDSELVLRLRGPKDLSVTARGESGPIHTYYPYSYLDFSPRATGSDTVSGSSTERNLDAVVSRSRGRNLAQAVGDDARALFAEGRATRMPEGVVMMPAAVRNGGREVRDTAAIVIAGSLGWKPGNGDLDRRGDHTPDGLRHARRHIADKLHLDRRHSPIDSGLESVALKALFSRTAGHEEGVTLTDLGSTRWSLTALPDLSGARVLDVVAGSRLSTTTESRHGLSGSSEHASGTALDPSVRPSGLTTGKDVYEKHEGVLVGAVNASLGSTTTTAADGREIGTAGPPTSRSQRMGPAYLVEFDTTWIIGASSAGKDPHTGRTRSTVAAWIAQADALRLGLVAPEQAARLNAEAERVHDAAETMGDDEQSYGRERGRLEEPVRDYVRAHEVHRRTLEDRTGRPRREARDGSSQTSEWAADRLQEARDAYHAQEDRYRRSLRQYEDSTRTWVDTLNAARRDFHLTAPGASVPTATGAGTGTPVLSDTTLRDTVAVELDPRAGDPTDPDADLRKKVDGIHDIVSDLHRRETLARSDIDGAAPLVRAADDLLAGRPNRAASPARPESVAPDPASVADLGTRVEAFRRDLADMAARDAQGTEDVAALDARRDALLEEARGLHGAAEEHGALAEEQARATRVTLDRVIGRMNRTRALLEASGDRVSRMRTETLNTWARHTPLAKDARDSEDTVARNEVERLGNDLAALHDHGRDLAARNHATRAEVDRVLNDADAVARRELPRYEERARIQHGLSTALAELGGPLVADVIADLRNEGDRGRRFFDDASDSLDGADRLLDARATEASRVPPPAPDLATTAQVTALTERVAAFERDLAAFAARPDRSEVDVTAMRERRDALLEETEGLDGPVAEHGRLISGERSATETVLARVDERTGHVRNLVDRSEERLRGLREEADRIAAEDAPFLGPREDLRTSLDEARTTLDDLETDRAALGGRLDGLRSRTDGLTTVEIPRLRGLENGLRTLHRDLDGLHTRIDGLEVPAATPRTEDDSDGSDSDSDDDAPPAPGTGRDGTDGGRAPRPGEGGTPPGRDGGSDRGTAGDGTRGSRSRSTATGTDPEGAPADRDVRPTGPERPVRTTSAPVDASAIRSAQDGNGDAPRRARTVFDDAESAERDEPPPAYDAQSPPPAYPYSAPPTGDKEKDAVASTGSGGFKGLPDPATLPPAVGDTDLIVFPTFVPDPDPVPPPTLAEAFADVLNPTLAEAYSPTGSDQDMLDVHRRYTTGTDGTREAAAADVTMGDGASAPASDAESPDWDAYVDLPGSPRTGPVGPEGSDVRMVDADSDGDGSDDGSDASSEGSSEGSGSEGAPPPVPGDPSTYPGHLDAHGIRRFAGADEADDYGSLILHDPSLAGPPLGTRPRDQRRAVFTYTASSWINVVARAEDRETGRRVLEEWADATRDTVTTDPEAEGWDLYELNDRTAPTLEDLRAARHRPDLTPHQRHLVERILGASDPQAELDHYRDNSGESGGMADLNDGRYPRLEDADRLMGRLDATITQRFPETTVAVRTLFTMDHLAGYVPGDPRRLVGTVQRDAGYMSAALGDEPAVVGDEPDPIRIHLLLPAGTPFVWVGDASAYPNQREILLPRGTRYRIRGVRVEGGDTVLFAEVLPPPAGTSA